MELRAHAIAIPAALSEASIGALERALSAAPVDRPWLLRSEGASFCSGMDLAEVLEGSPAKGLQRFARLLRNLVQRAAVPTIALVEGEARGGGVGIAAACDLVLATDRASFALPEALFGLSPALIAPVLLTRMSPQKLRLLALRGAAVDAAGAERLGLVDRVVAPDQVEAALRRAVRELSRASSDALPSLRALSLGTRRADAIAGGAAHTLERLRDPSVLARVARFLEHGAAPWSE